MIYLVIFISRIGLCDGDNNDNFYAQLGPNNTCTACTNMMNDFQHMAVTNVDKLEGDLDAMIKSLCKSVGVDNDVCFAFLQTFEADIENYVASMNVEDACGQIMMCDVDQNNDLM